MWILGLKGLTMCRHSSDKARWSDDMQGMVMQKREREREFGVSACVHHSLNCIENHPVPAYA